MLVTKRNSNKGRQVDGKAKKRLIYLHDKHCEDCLDDRVKSMVVTYLCYKNRVTCFNCIAQRRAQRDFKYVLTRNYVVSPSTVALQKKKSKVMTKACYYCGNDKRYAQTLEKGGHRFKCFNCIKNVPRTYDVWYRQFLDDKKDTLKSLDSLK
jgi:hypothetical protein